MGSIIIGSQIQNRFPLKTVEEKSSFCYVPFCLPWVFHGPLATADINEFNWITSNDATSSWVLMHLSKPRSLNIASRMYWSYLTHKYFVTVGTGKEVPNSFVQNHFVSCLAWINVLSQLVHLTGTSPHARANRGHWLGWSGRVMGG